MDIISTAKSLIAALGIKTDSPLFGKENWIAVAVAIIAATTGIFYSNTLEPFLSIPAFVILLIIGMIGLSVMSAFVYPLKDSPDAEITPTLAGIWLSKNAAALKSTGKSMFDIMESYRHLAYDIWPASSLAVTRSISLLSFFVFVFSASSLVGLSSRDSLKTALDKWMTILEVEENRKFIYRSDPFPANIVISRVKLEDAWLKTSLNQRQTYDQKSLHKAMHEVVESYRSQEEFSLRKKLSLYWSNQMIDYFRSAGLPNYYGLSLLQQGAIYLDIAQDHHTDYEKFISYSKDGEKVITAASIVVTGASQSKAYRMLGRIYYDRSRPKSLSENWNDAYLDVSYDRLIQAIEVSAPDPSNKNLLQLARTVQKAAANTSNSGSKWQERGKDTLAKLYDKKSESLDNRSDLIGKVAYLNILGVLGHDVILNAFLTNNGEIDLKDLAHDIEDIAIAAQNEAFVLASQTPRLYSHRFDLSYDLARMHAVNSQILAETDEAAAKNAFQKCKSALIQGISHAKSQQIRDVKKDLERHPSWYGLPAPWIAELASLLP